MVPLSAPTAASQEVSAPFGDKESRNDKEKDKGEKSNRDKSAPIGQATGRIHYPLTYQLSPLRSLVSTSLHLFFSKLTTLCLIV